MPPQFFRMIEKCIKDQGNCLGNKGKTLLEDSRYNWERKKMMVCAQICLGIHWSLDEFGQVIFLYQAPSDQTLLPQGRHPTFHLHTIARPPPLWLCAFQIEQLVLEWLRVRFLGPGTVLYSAVHLFSSSLLGGHSHVQPGEAGQGESLRSWVVATTKLTDSHGAGTRDLRDSQAIIINGLSSCFPGLRLTGL